MKTHQLIRAILSLMLFGTLLVPALASAQDATVNAGAAVNANVGATQATASASTTVRTKAMDNAISRADKELDRRVTALTDLLNRVSNMQAVTASFKQNLATNIQTLGNALVSLKAKIDADTDAATLKSDVQSITTSYRIYMLVLPQSRIAAQADRTVTIVAMMQQIGTKLSSRISAAQSGGADVSALTAALNDLATQLQTASTQSQAAVSATASLQPDQGDKTKMASNVATLKTARTDLQAAQKALVAARKDINTILQGLQKIHVQANASSTTQTSTGTQQ